MKKLLLAGLLVASCTAFAAIPEGYSPYENPDDDSDFTIRNETTGGIISISQLATGGGSAIDEAESFVETYKCKEKATGDDSFAQVNNCEAGGEIWNVQVRSDEHITFMVKANNKATPEEIKVFLKMDE